MSQIILCGIGAMVVGALIAIIAFAKGAAASAKTMFRILSMSKEEFQLMKQHFENDKSPKP